MKPQAGEIRRKPSQHHVWQRYLGAWAIDDCVFCLQNGRIFRTGTPVLGVGMNFYKTPALTDEDLGLMHLVAGLEQVHPIARDHYEKVLERVLTTTLFVRANRDRLNNLPRIDELLDAYNTNVVDDYHTLSEATFLPLLDRTLEGDISWYDDGSDCISFCAFVGAQIMRTRPAKERTIARLRDRMNLDISRIWNVLALIFGFNIGSSLYQERRTRHLELVRNQTEVSFVTGDQPAINLHTSDDHKPPDKLSLYFPVSPRLALHLGEPGEMPLKAVSTEAVTALNRQMASASHSQVYADSAEPLEAIGAFA